MVKSQFYEFIDENEDILKSLGIAILMMILIVLPNFCFKITDQEFKEKKKQMDQEKIYKFLKEMEKKKKNGGKKLDLQGYIQELEKEIEESNIDKSLLMTEEQINEKRKERLKGLKDEDIRKLFQFKNKEK